MPPSQQPNNPYASAAGAYGNNAQKHATDPRELEARVLLKSAQYLQDIKNDLDDVSSDDLETVLKYNRAIWVMFLDNAISNEDSAYPDNLRANIASLANFIFKRELDIMANPEKSKLDTLININRNIAEGLMKGAKAAPIAPEASQIQQQTDTTSDPTTARTDTSA